MLNFRKSIQILALDALKRNDPSIYNDKSKFYETESESDSEEKSKTEKSLTLKDYERNVVLKKGGIIDEEEEEMEELTEPSKSGKSHKVKISSLSLAGKMTN
jgi:hypothetical protein